MNQMTIDQIHDFEVAATCHICEMPFSDENKKVRDHCHLTGQYRGPAPARMKKLATDLKGGVYLLPINKERYISFTKR